VRTALGKQLVEALCALEALLLHLNLEGDARDVRDAGGSLVHQSAPADRRVGHEDPINYGIRTP
jgi:hypothetical protein